MKLSEQQRRVAQGLLKQFADSGMSLTNQGVTYSSYRDLDKARAEAIPELRCVFRTKPRAISDQAEGCRSGLKS